MVLAVGMSQYTLSAYHLVNHAYFKALLFLSAGATVPYNLAKCSEYFHYVVCRNQGPRVSKISRESNIPSEAICEKTNKRLTTEKGPSIKILPLI